MRRLLYSVKGDFWLPSWYIQLPYVISKDGNGVLDTNIKPNSNTIFTMSMEIISWWTYTQFFWCREKAAGSDVGNFWLWVNGSLTRYPRIWTAVPSIPTASSNLRYDLIVNVPEWKLYINNDSYNVGNTIECEYTVWIGKMNGTTLWAVWEFKIYSFSLNNGTDSMNCLPCRRDNDLAIWFYDIYSDTFLVGDWWFTES